MDRAHRNNVLVTSCLKTPVDPNTKVPLAQYEREQQLNDNREYEKEVNYDSGSELGAGEVTAKDSSPLLIKDYRVTGDHIDLREFYFSNEEYYRKLEQLKRAHLRTMAELELMYRKKLQLKSAASPIGPERANLLQWGGQGLLLSGNLKKAHSAHELRRPSALLDTDEDEEEDEEEHVVDNERSDRDPHSTEKGLLLSPKEHIKNMWQHFSIDKLSPRQRNASSTSLQNPLGVGPSKKVKSRGLRSKKRKQTEEESWHPKVTVPKPFHMTVREAERKRKGVKSRAEIEWENAELRRQLEEVTECQRKFRAGSVPAHVRLPLYEEMQERDEERRQRLRTEDRRTQKPFSFLERERVKKEQKEEQLREQMLLLAKEEEERRRRPFRAKPVPRVVKEAVSGEQQKEQALYRSIKMNMRAQELMQSSLMPPSTLARRLSERRAKKDGTQGEQHHDEASHRPRINPQVPDFDASYKRFQKQLASKRDVRPVTACEPFELRTAKIASHKERIMADVEAERRSPRASRWPFVNPGTLTPRTPSSSVCSSLSGSQEQLSAKITDAARRRQEAVRKVLEQRKKAEEEEERWRERQRLKERKLQKVISKRAEAHDPHTALAQTCKTKLKEFRKQDLQRLKEYKEEMKEIQERVKSRPLLLEQVAQMNAKQAAVRRYAEALSGYGLNEAFVSSKVPKNLNQRTDVTPSPVSDSDYPLRHDSVPSFARDYRSADELEGAASADESLPGDYADDYEEYEHGTEGELVDGENDGELENKETDNSESVQSDKEGDERLSYGDDLDFDSADDHRDSDKDSDDDNSKRNSSGERECSDEEGRSSSKDGGRKDEGKCGQSVL